MTDTDLFAIASHDISIWYFLCMEISELSKWLNNNKPNPDDFFDGQKIKEILTAIRQPESNFEVIIKNEYNCYYSGYYNYSKDKITLYLPNLNNNRELIIVAIHEYAHHFTQWEHHRTKFWECYFELLEIAERKGLYSCNIDSCENLKKITEIINKNNMIKNRNIFKEKLHGIFYIIHKLCEEINVNFEHYTVKHLGMEWYKKKIPRLSYNQFCRNYVLCERVPFENINDFLQKFFNDYGSKVKEP
jgi:hypothetical protein